MIELLTPIGLTILIWWFATGVVLLLDQVPQGARVYVQYAAAAVMALALIGFADAATQATPTAALSAFAFALICWGWLELTFYAGFITGPRQQAATPGVKGLQRFREAAGAVLYHEIAIAVMAAVLVLLAWNGANQVGVWTFMVLWGMRLSAKLNMFLGVRNHAEAFLPAHMAYLSSYFRKRAMNALFPLSVTVSSLITAWLFQQAMAAPAGTFAQTGLALVATLMALAVLEHWFLVLPLEATKLWTPLFAPAAVPAAPATTPDRHHPHARAHAHPYAPADDRAATPAAVPPASTRTPESLASRESHVGPVGRVGQGEQVILEGDATAHRSLTGVIAGSPTQGPLAPHVRVSAATSPWPPPLFRLRRARS
ncbi:MAG: putative photosynthetic complex assembly protein PuhE [Pseudomonadota bacterium]